MNVLFTLIYLVWITLYLNCAEAISYCLKSKNKSCKHFLSLLITHGCEQSKRIREEALQQNLENCWTASYGLHSKENLVKSLLTVAVVVAGEYARMTESPFGYRDIISVLETKVTLLWPSRTDYNQHKHIHVLQDAANGAIVIYFS